MFNQEELKNLLALTNLAPISGKEAWTIALLQQKLATLITPKENTEEKVEKKPKK